MPRKLYLIGMNPCDQKSVNEVAEAIVKALPPPNASPEAAPTGALEGDEYIDTDTDEWKVFNAGSWRIMGTSADRAALGAEDWRADWIREHGERAGRGFRAACTGALVLCLVAALVVAPGGWVRWAGAVLVGLGLWSAWREARGHLIR